VAAYLIKVPNVITPVNVDGNNDVFTIQYGDAKNITPGNFGIKTSLEVYDRWGKPVYESKDYQYNWAAEGLAAGVYYFKVTIEDHATCKSWLHVIK
jgi:gliding motility-associated-like protein